MTALYSLKRQYPWSNYKTSIFISNYKNFSWYLVVYDFDLSTNECPASKCAILKTNGSVVLGIYYHEIINGQILDSRYLLDKNEFYNNLNDFKYIKSLSDKFVNIV